MPALACLATFATDESTLLLRRLLAEKSVPLVQVPLELVLVLRHFSVVDIEGPSLVVVDDDDLRGLIRGLIQAWLPGIDEGADALELEHHLRPSATLHVSA